MVLRASTAILAAGFHIISIGSMKNIDIVVPGQRLLFNHFVYKFIGRSYKGWPPAMLRL